MIEKYPFLLPRNRWTSKVVDNYDYNTTELEAMPDGWRTAFGESLCKEILNELFLHNCLDTYRITQIKEKYGQLCWYDIGGTPRIHQEILPRYEALSMRTCIKCGQPATPISTGWISPWCSTCLKEFPWEHFVGINASPKKKE